MCNSYTSSFLSNKIRAFDIGYYEMNSIPFIASSKILNIAVLKKVKVKIIINVSIVYIFFAYLYCNNIFVVFSI